MTSNDIIMISMINNNDIIKWYQMHNDIKWYQLPIRKSIQLFIQVAVAAHGSHQILPVATGAQDCWACMLCRWPFFFWTSTVLWYHSSLITNITITSCILISDHAQPCQSGTPTGSWLAQLLQGTRLRMEKSMGRKPLLNCALKLSIYIQ